MQNEHLLLRTALFILLLFSSAQISFAQEDSSSIYTDDFGGLFYLDSIVVQASRQGFEVADFVDMVQTDESFYKSFQKLRVINYSSDQKMELYTKETLTNPSVKNVKDHYNSSIHQVFDGKCRKISFEKEERSKGFFKKKRKHRYYTGKLLDRLFQSEACEGNEAQQPAEKKESRTSRHIDELKKLIFSPGQKADVPIIGNKTAIFEKKMTPFYNFLITSKKFKGAIECYVFTAEVKPEYKVNKKDKTVIKYLETYFDKTTFEIVARNYTLEYAGALFDFNIDMSIECQPFGESFLPTLIKYDGYWDVPARKPEISTFSIQIRDPH